MKVTSSIGEGIIEGAFGKSGKFNVRFSADGIQGACAAHFIPLSASTAAGTRGSS